MHNFMVIAVSLALLFCVVLVLLIIAVYRSQKNIQQLQLQHAEMQLQLITQQKQFDEYQAIPKLADDEVEQLSEQQQQLTAQLLQVQQKLAQVQTNIEKLQAECSQDKHYLKAANLVADGATLEQIMQECELPRAEAEILIALHQQNS